MTICWPFRKRRARRRAFSSARSRPDSNPGDWKPFEEVGAGTSKQDKDIAAARYRAVVKGRRVKP
jgi:hypothetical protein